MQPSSKQPARRQLRVIRCAVVEAMEPRVLLSGGSGVDIHSASNNAITASALVAPAATGFSFTVSGAQSASTNSPYTLDLTPDPSNSTPVLQWNILWGDGSFQTVPGTATSMSHVYNGGGTRTIPITVSATTAAGTFYSPSSFPSPGTPDSSFGTAGPIALPGPGDVPIATALTADRKIVCLFRPNSADSALIARFNPDGSPDASFGHAGIASIPGPAGYVCSPENFALQSDGKIVIAGEASKGNIQAILLTRLNADGTLDTSFADNGWLPLSNLNVNVNDVTIQSDGEILLTGTYYTLSTNTTPFNSQIMLARFNSDGTPDTNFGNQGIATGGPNISRASASFILPDQRILVGAGTTSTERLVLNRFLPNGQVDPTFAGAPALAVSNGARVSFAMQLDGKLLVDLGTSVVRINSDGSQDLSFGTAGFAPIAGMVSSPPFIPTSTIALQADGKFDVVSVNISSSVLDQFNPNGSPDISFGTAGIVQLTSPQQQVYSQTLVVQPDGDIVFPLTQNKVIGIPGSLKRFVAQPVSLNVNLTDAPFAINTLPVIGVAGYATTSRLLTFSDATTGPMGEYFSASVNWGDGTTSTPLILPNPDHSFSVLDTHSFTAGQYNIQITVTDNGGATLSTTVPATITLPVNGNASISGNVFNDLNQDGFRETGEPPLPGWTVFFDLNGNNAPDPGEPAALVAADGSYTLADLAPGIGSVLFAPQPLWTPALPLTGSALRVRRGQIINGVDLGATHAPPTATARFNYDQFPPSLTYSFSEPVSGTTTPGAVSVYDLDTGTPLTLGGASYNPVFNTLTVLMTGPIVDGNYESILSSMAITDAAGQHLNTTSNTAAPGNDFVYNFFSLTGDLNHDGIVNMTDYDALDADYRQPGTYAQGDINGDGYVDFADLAMLAANFNAFIQPPIIHAGDLIVSSTFDNTVYDVAPGGSKTVIANVAEPEGVAADPFGNIYITETSGSPTDRLVKVTNAGVQTTFVTFASNLTNPEGLAIRPDGTLLVTGNFGSNPGFGPPSVASITPDGQVHPFANAGSGEDIAATLDSAGNLYVADVDTGWIWKITSAGVVTRFATGFDYATGIAVTPDGKTVLIADKLDNAIWAVAQDGSVSVYLSILRPFSLLFDPQGNLDVGQDLDTPDTSSVIQVHPDGTQTILATGFDGVRGLALVSPPAPVLLSLSIVAAVIDKLSTSTPTARSSAEKRTAATIASTPIAQPQPTDLISTKKHGKTYRKSTRH